MWDLIIAGLGPAGSTAAQIAAKAGLNVLALDRASFPRYKPCAAGLTGRAVKIIPVALEDYLEVSVERAQIRMGSMPPVDIYQPDGLMVTTRRETLDMLLLRTAEAAGATIREECSVQSIEIFDESVIVSTSSGKERSRFLIGADGANSVAARYICKQRLSFLPAWEVEFEYNPANQSDFIVRFDLGIVPRGYGWAFPKLNTISVGVAGRLSSRQAIDAAFNSMISRLPGSEKWRPIISRGHPVPLFDPKYKLAANRILLTGDAGGLIDPFLGEGIYYALVSGRIAAQWVSENIDSDKPKYREYSTEITATIGRELMLARRLASVIYRFPKTMFKLTSLNPGILTTFGESLADPEGYCGFASRVGFPYRMMFWGV
ncbi:geranylgeranyl reductase family protein [bacterium]|nr:geranylgeranyl reductase family protein [bacterium]